MMVSLLSSSPINMTSAGRIDGGWRMEDAVCEELTALGTKKRRRGRKFRHIPQMKQLHFGGNVNNT